MRATGLPTWSEEEMIRQYKEAQELHRTRVELVSKKRLPDRKRRVEQEWCDWWARRPANWREGPVQPEDVVAFLEQFLRGHSIRARTFTEAGERVVHFNTVEKEVSHLCSWIRRHGAEGEWRTKGSQGNPCKSDCVRMWKRTY